MQKIAILGGGVGSLTTAMELTNDPLWQQKYEITIYQMGWRLGGKGASGRNRGMADRIQEHGIHLWMGFYENAFNMIRKAYDEAHAKNLMPDSPFTDARKAFSPMNYTPMMEQYKGQWKMWPIHWPGNDPANWPNDQDPFPGDDVLFRDRLEPPTPAEYLDKLLSQVLGEIDDKKARHPVLVMLYRFAVTLIVNGIGAVRRESGKTKPPFWRVKLGKWAKKLNDIMFRIYGLFSSELEKNDDLRHFFIIVDTALAIVIGMIEDDVVEKGFLAIENHDFIEWLSKHGCHHPDSPLTVGMYDACFGYRHGKEQERLMGAGSTLYGALRLMFTYKGALMWWMNAGMGETIMSPLYLVLKSRGVKFKFFHKVKNLRLSADKSAIDSVDIEVQATTKAGDYDPLFPGIDGIPCWPTEPLWAQVAQAEEIQKCANPDLESWWTDWKGVSPPLTLTRGRDFDLVVLGISLGAHKYICQELIQANTNWANMVEKVELVRTQALQLWMNRDLNQAGWTTGRGILCGYMEPFDTWSDMSHLIPREKWGPGQDVQQIAYFCNVIPDDELKGFEDPNYPASELKRVKDYSRTFLDQGLVPIWPKTVDPQKPGTFNDNILVNCAGDPKQANFDTQFFRVNIDPSELYVLSLPGTANYRMPSGESGFTNLFLAGDWTLTDINIGCIEAAVTSGRMASRAICGKPDYIFGAFGSVIPIRRMAAAK